MEKVTFLHETILKTASLRAQLRSLRAAAPTIAAPVETESTEGKNTPSIASFYQEDIDLAEETAPGVGVKDPTLLLEYK